MSKYDELVKALRCENTGDDECGSSDCTYWSGLGCMDGQLMEDAADAIEELQAEVEELKAKKMKLAENSLRFVGKVRELDKRRLEPKRGEWIGRQNHKKCSVCGKQAIYDVALYTDMKTPYCPHCGAKMEVQE